LIPLPVEKEAEEEEANMQELEKKYEEIEKHLVDTLDENDERMKYLSQIDIERHMKELSPKKNRDNFFLTNNNINNLNQENFDSNNNVLSSNSKLNSSHVSKHRLMNMNSEKSHKFEGENENNLSKISLNKLNNDKNESEKQEDQNIINKLNTSKYSKRSVKAEVQESNEEEAFNNNSQLKHPEANVYNNADEDNYYVNSEGERVKKTTEAKVIDMENADGNNLEGEYPDEANAENKNEDMFGKNLLEDEKVEEGENNNDIKNNYEENVEMQGDKEVNESSSKEKENIAKSINSSKLKENVNNGKKFSFFI
jgi:hypothetical protein